MTTLTKRNENLAMNISNLSLLNPWIGALAIIAIVIISVTIQLIRNRWFADEDIENVHNVGGIYMSAVGTLYSVILGMTLVDASGNFSSAKECIVKESEGLVKTHAYSLQMPEMYREEVSTSIMMYIEHLINYESMHVPNKETRKNSRPLFVRIRHAVEAIEPETDKQKIIYQQMLAEFEKASEGRMERYSFSNNTLTLVEWICLIVGGIISITFSFFFYIKNRLMHALMTGMISLMLSLNLYAVYMLSEPFTIFMKIPTDILQDLHDYIDETKRT